MGKIRKNANTSLSSIKSEVELSKRELAKQDPEKSTAEHCVRESVRVLIDKEAVLDRAQILHHSARISGGQHDLKSLSDAIDRVAERIGATPKGRELYTTQEMRQLEQRAISDELKWALRDREVFGDERRFDALTTVLLKIEHLRNALADVPQMRELRASSRQ